MSILSNGHLWKLTEFLENQNFSFNKNQILDSLSKEDIDDAYAISQGVSQFFPLTEISRN